MDASSVAISVLDPPTGEEPIPLTEVRDMISKLKGLKAAGTCDIPFDKGTHART